MFSRRKKVKGCCSQKAKKSNLTLLIHGHKNEINSILEESWSRLEIKTKIMCVDTFGCHSKRQRGHQGSSGMAFEFTISNDYNMQFKNYRMCIACQKIVILKQCKMHASYAMLIIRMCIMVKKKWLET